MKTLQQKKDCLIALLNRYQDAFTRQIEELNIVLKEEDYDIFYTDLCVSLAKTHKELLSELQLCQNINGPDEIQKINL